MKKVLILLLLFIVACGGSREETVVQDTTNTTAQDTTTTTAQDTTTTTAQDTTTINKGIESKICNEWVGSDNFVSCLYGFTTNYVSQNDYAINNIYLYKDRVLIIAQDGKVFELKEDYSYFEIFDFNNILGIASRGVICCEVGLLDIEIYEDKLFVTATTSEILGELVLYQFDLNENDMELENPLLLFSARNESCCHFSGSLSLIKQTGDLLLGIGDMNSTLSIDPQKTTNHKGKILRFNLNKNESFFEESKLRISDNSITPPLKNLVAYGLRNPWNIYVNDNILFIPDVGHSKFEELNIFDLENLKLPNFGWPLYEAKDDGKFSKDNAWFLNPENLEKKYYTNLYLYKENNRYPLEDYFDELHNKPNLYYSHTPNESLYRAAIIGGNVIKNPDSFFDNFYIFGDYITKELFTYDLLNDRVYQLAYSRPEEGSLTGIRYLMSKNVVLITLDNGKIYKVDIPDVPKLNDD